MEQFVLGLVQDQLSKVIVGFRKEQINANLLNGKGEITDVSLNCSVLNEHVRKLSPLFEFESIHLSRLGFHVTAWANLRKAPIAVDIGTITVVVKEPLDCLPKKLRRQLQIVTEKELVELILNGLFKPLRGNGSYGFADRIVDNLMIEIEQIKIHVQIWGKFKTKRKGPWTPPELQIRMEHMKVVAVDEYGHEATPDQVWAHNRMGMKNFMLYKKMSGDVHINVVDAMTGQAVHLISHLKFENQMAIKRRLRDGAVLGVQSDLTIPSINIEIEAPDVPILAHLVTATQYCFGKEKTFTDPLRMDDSSVSKQTTFAPNIECNAPSLLDKDEDSVGDESDDDDDGHDSSENSDVSDGGSDGSTSQQEQSIAEEQSKPPHASHAESLAAPYKERPIVILPNGLVIYESVCLTCSIHDVMIRGIYPSHRHGNLQISSKGCITEFIWPKANNEPGFYLQASVSFVSVLERLDKSVRTILLGGITHGDHMSIHQPHNAPREVPADENFPMFERRSLRDDPLELRHTFPSQAFGTKTSVDVNLDRGDNDVPPMVVQEIGVDEFDIALDADACCRALGFLLNENGGGFDPRWQTGDWTELLTHDMLKDPGTALSLDDHLQTAKQIFLDDNFMLSSDRFNMTARLSNVELRVPAAITENVRSCDILVQVQETMLILSSALPRTFLSGKIGNSIQGYSMNDEVEVDFPNDPRDIAYTLMSTEDPSLRLSGVKLSRNVSTCRAQLTMRGFQITTIPVIPFCDAIEAQRLVSPMDVTMIVCFEGEPPPPGSHLTKIAFFLSIHVYDFGLNMDFDLLAGSASTLLYHYDVVAKTVNSMAELFPALQTAPSHEKATEGESSSQVKKSIKGRKLMVKRHLARSRETGGLSVVFCMQVSKANLTLWRQNAPSFSPLRKPVTVEAKAEHDAVVRLLKLAEIQATEFEIGIEFDSQMDSRSRTVAKCCVEEGRVLVCDVKSAMGLETSGNLITYQGDLQANRNMAELVSFGKNKLPDKLNQSCSGSNQHVAIRLEEQIKESQRSWSLSADLNCQAVINACVEEVKDSLILCLEELLLPTWSNRELPQCEGAPFPPKTIGAMLHFLMKPSGTSPLPLKLSQQDLIPPSVDGSDEPVLERVLMTLCERFLPSDLSLVLFRVEMANLLLSIPNAVIGREKKSLGMHLMQTDLVVRLYPKRNLRHSDIENILACKGVVWSSLIKSTGGTYYQCFSSRQSLLLITTNTGEVVIEELVHPFRVELSYSASNVHLSMGEDLKIKDIRRLESFTDGMKAIGERCLQYQTEVLLYLKSMQQPGNSVVSDAVARPVVEPKESTVEQGDNGEGIAQYSLTRTQQMIQLARLELGHYEHEIRVGQMKNIETAHGLQRQVFAKEKERFAALALSFSSAAGWIRTGGVHHTGQRVARKSALWPHWAVLRKNLLILYHSPTEPRPIDIILLDGAKLRQLSGGNGRQDVKRGFAIIESEGTTRYFITSNSREFSQWVQKIREAIYAYSLDVPMSDLGLEAEPNIDEAGNPVCFEYGDPIEDVGEEGKPGRGRRLGARITGARNRIGAVLENAKQKGKEMVDMRQDGGVDSSSGDELINAAQGGPEDRSLPTRDTEEPAGPKRRIQLGGTFAGVKEATRSKIGTAIQNARQKIPEARSGSSAQVPPRTFAGVRNKLRGISSGAQATDIESQKRSFGGSTHGEEGQEGSSEDDLKQTSEIFDSADAVDNPLNDMSAQTKRSDGNDSVENGASNEGSKRGRFSAIGSAVRSATQNRLVRSRGVESSNGSFHDDAPVTLKSVHVGRILEPTLYTSAQEEIPLKKLEGNWYVSVVVISRTNGHRPSNPTPPPDSSGAPSHDTLASNSTISTGLTSNQCDDEANSQSIPEPKWNLEYPVFAVRRRRLDGVEDTSSEHQCGYGSLFRLHSRISESVAQLLYFGVGVDKRAADTQRGRIDPNLVNLVDQVSVTGTALGGVLENGISEQSFMRTAAYHAELLEQFINAILQCPLPVDALLEVSEFLGISASTKEQRPAAGDDISNGQENNDTFATTDRPRHILNILSVCEAELVRAIKAGIKNPVPVSTLPVIQENISPPSSMPMPSKLEVQTQLYDPLLPPSVSGIMQKAMHEALISAMSERDQAHAQLIAMNVLHVHELEQERRKNEKLKLHQIVKEERGRLQQPNVANFFQNLNDDRARKGLHMKLDGIEKMLTASNESELSETSRQLAEEMSAKTSHALEIVRLKELREIEKKNYDAETQALKEELRRVKALLTGEIAKAEELEKIVSAQQAT